MNSQTLSGLPPDLLLGAVRSERRRREWERCRADAAHFIDAHCWIDTEPTWERFRLWPAQRSAIAELTDHRRVVALKARQLGLSWLALALALHQAIFVPGTTSLFFSKGEKEARELLRRLRGMVDRLPDWLRPGLSAPTNTEELTFANESNVKIFPTTGGRSYTGSLAIVDEADWLVPDDKSGADRLPALLNAVKPTVDAGGRLVLLSSPRKAMPDSAFKAIYRAAKAGENSYRAVFLPWSARPGRTLEWYEEQKRDCLAQTGSLDDLQQEYPGTDAEALAPRSLDKRLPAEWLLACYSDKPAESRSPPHQPPPAIRGLVCYRWPRHGETFVIGADPAEGNPTSDDSAFTVLDAATWEEVASLAGRFEPSVFAAHIDAAGRYYHNAGVLVERNNHGHAVLLWLRDNSRLARLGGHDGNVGWLSSGKGKPLMYDAAADAFRQRETTIHTFATYVQLSSIEGATLRAPAGQKDDMATGYALALVALARGAAPSPSSFRPKTLGAR
jgi:hypothetical protein